MKNKDLSPVRSAAKQLAGLLPRPELPEGEMWQFFHFQTNDYCTVERTVRLACEQKGMPGQPLFVSAGEFCGWVSGGAGKKRKEDDYDFQGAEELQEGLREGHLIFVWQAFMKNESGQARDPKYSQLMLEFLRYCENQRAEGLWAGEHGRAWDGGEDISKKVIFISYGPSCPLPELLRESLRTISYAPLAPEDFSDLLGEYWHRQEECRQRRYGGRELAEVLLGPAGECPVFDSKTLEWYADNMAGISEANVRRLFMEMLSQDYVDFARTDEIERIIVNYKNKVLQQHGRLEVLSAGSVEGKGIYGLDTVESWLRKHERIIRKPGLAPGGILLVGIPGTGKSAPAKMAAQVMPLPLVKLDMSRILGGYVGDSEKGMREMLEDLKFAAPCVLWIDEVEKAMSGANGKRGEGSGVMERLFGMLLTFMQENDRIVFSVTTANDISQLPPEFFRNGRFDQAFCVMMPEYSGCCRIMQGKLAPYMRSLGWLGPKESVSAGYAREVFDACIGTKERPRFLTGADIEAHVKELFCDYGEGRGGCPPAEEMADRMRQGAGQMRAQGSADSVASMRDIASRYLDMIQRGFIMAGSSETPFAKENLNLNAVRYYEYEKGHKALPESCVLHPDPEKLLRALESDVPAEWYDARFFQCVVHEMDETVIFDRELTLEETRKAYHELMVSARRR